MPATSLHELSIEAEMQVIGLCLQGHELPNELPVIADEAWDNPAHASVWRAINSLHGSGCRLLTSQQVASATGRELDELGRANLIKHLDRCGGSAPIMEASSTELMLNLSGSATRELGKKRQLIMLADEAKSLSADPSLSVSDILSRLDSDLAKLRVGESLAPVTLRQLVTKLADDLDKPATVMSTGLPRIDGCWAGGLWTGKLYGIAARMKVGKTIGLATIARNVAAVGKRVLYVALEMGQAEVAQRVIADRLGCNSVHFLHRDDPDMPMRLLGYACRNDAPELDNLMFRDCPGCTFEQLRGIAQTAVSRHEISLLVLDYWQLVQGMAKGQTETQHLGAVAQWLADFARRSGIAVLTAAQINRDGQTRGSDGLRLACDWYGHMHPVGDRQRWIEALDSRYAMRSDVGGEAQPVLYIDNVGPMLRESR